MGPLSRSPDGTVQLKVPHSNNHHQKQTKKSPLHWEGKLRLSVSGKPGARQMLFLPPFPRGTKQGSTVLSAYYQPRIRFQIRPLIAGGGEEK